MRSITNVLPSECGGDAKLIVIGINVYQESNFIQVSSNVHIDFFKNANLKAFK